MGKIDIKARDAKIKQYEKFSQELMSKDVPVESE